MDDDRLSVVVVTTESGDRFFSLQFKDASNIAAYKYMIDSIHCAYSDQDSRYEGSFTNHSLDCYMPTLCFPYVSGCRYIMHVDVEPFVGDSYTCRATVSDDITTEQLIEFLDRHHITTLKAVNRIVDMVMSSQTTKISLRDVFAYCKEHERVGDAHENNYKSWTLADIGSM